MHSAEKKDEQTQTHNPLKRICSYMNDSSPDMGLNPPDDPSLQEAPSSPNAKNYIPRRFLPLFFFVRICVLA
jgi:hypothetical protein